MASDLVLGGFDRRCVQTLPLPIEQVYFERQPEEASDTFQNYLHVIDCPQVPQFFQQKGRPEIEFPKGDLTELLNILPRHSLWYEGRTLIREV